MGSRVIFPNKYAGETILLSVDFGPLLAAGESISTSSNTVTPYLGVDANPAAMLTTENSISNTTVNRGIAGGVVGVTYIITFTVVTSLANTLIVQGFLTVVPTAP